MTVTEAIQRRRSIRKYKPGERIPRQQVEEMLEAAMLAPSAGGTRPWEFVVVESRAILEEIPKIHPYCRFLPDASLAIVVCGLPERQPGMLEGYWPQDCGAATENLLLKATEMGYGTCWCGVYPIAERVTDLQALLQIASVPLAVVAVGVPDEAPEQRGHYEPERVKYL